MRREPGVEWGVPTEPTTDPLASAFRVDVSAAWRSVPLHESTLPLLPAQFPMRLLGPAAFPDALSLAEREFHGALELPCVTGLPADVSPANLGRLGEFDVVVELRFSEELVDPLVALRVSDGPDGHAASRVTVRSSSVWWSTVMQYGVPISSWRR